jgi:hypothetical protein
MMNLRLHYWSCSKFADWIRGEKKPHVLGWDEWDEWHKNAKSKRPFRYWLAEKGLTKIQNFLYYPFDVYKSVKYYIRNRYFDKLQYLNTGLQPGKYYDFDTRILHGLFNELVNFVEIELAHLGNWDRNKKYIFKHGRCVEAAYDYFEWASDLKHDEEHGFSSDDPNYGKPTDQAKNAIKIKELYEWWKYERPNRINPYSPTKENYKNSLDIEEEYETEDTNKLIELIKIRKSFWT